MTRLAEVQGSKPDTLSAIGLFAGIGGIELGLHRVGFEATDLVEIDTSARKVLAHQFPHARLHGDIRRVKYLPPTNVIAAGFPCQDLSQAGRKVGIAGRHSSLVAELFRLCRTIERPAKWILIENVSYMLRLDRGRAMGFLTSSLEELGYTWAYRVVDARSFGVPQRRQRVLLVASRSEDPRQVLFADDGDPPPPLDVIGPVDRESSYGFYWTEGLRGLGWAANSVPTVKGGSLLGIPSPPAVWHPDRNSFGTPSLKDVERLQGFEPGWTDVAAPEHGQKDQRWRLLGNAVCVPMAEWVGGRILNPAEQAIPEEEMPSNGWPAAAWGRAGRHRRVSASMWPLGTGHIPLREFLIDEIRPLSRRAVTGFLSRAGRGRLRFADGFLDALRRYVAA